MRNEATKKQSGFSRPTFVNPELAQKHIWVYAYGIRLTSLM